MNDVPSLTVGIPARNEGRFLRDTLESIRKQSFRSYVVYVCDDSSTDNTREIASEFARQDDRFKLITSDERLTFVENWARSLERCDTMYFVWIGAHDVLEPSYFDSAVTKHLQDKNLALVYPRSIAIDAEGRFGHPFDSDLSGTGEESADMIMVAQNLQYCTAIHGVFRTEILKRLPLRRIIGFDYLILVLTGLYGRIDHTETVTFYRRVVRTENPEEAIERWRTSGMFERSNYSPFVVLVANCLLEFMKRSRLGFAKRLLLGQKLLRILANKHGVSKWEVLSCAIRIRRQ